MTESEPTMQKQKKQSKAVKAVKAANAVVSKAEGKAKRTAWRNKITFDNVKNGVKFTLSIIKGIGNTVERSTVINKATLNTLAKKFANKYGEQDYKAFRAEASVSLAAALQCDSKAKKAGLVTNTSYDACADAMAEACKLTQMSVKQKGAKVK